MRDARLLVLVSLSDGPSHGYSIQQDVAAFTGVHLGPGTLYGAINGLERDGLIERLSASPRRHTYRLTADGRRQLCEQLRTLDRIRARTAGVRLA